jgi:hypothetical protein
MGPQCKWRKLPAGWNVDVAFPAARHRAGLRELRGAARAGRPATFWDRRGRAGRRPSENAGGGGWAPPPEWDREATGTGPQATLTQGRSCARHV